MKRKLANVIRVDNPDINVKRYGSLSEALYLPTLDVGRVVNIYTN